MSLHFWIWKSFTFYCGNFPTGNLSAIMCKDFSNRKIWVIAIFVATCWPSQPFCRQVIHFSWEVKIECYAFIKIATFIWKRIGKKTSTPDAIIIIIIIMLMTQTETLAYSFGLDQTVSVLLSIQPSIYLSVRITVSCCMSNCLSVCPFVRPSFSLSFDNLWWFLMSF